MGFKKILKPLRWVWEGISHADTVVSVAQANFWKSVGVGLTGLAGGIVAFFEGFSVALSIVLGLWSITAVVWLIHGVRKLRTDAGPSDVGLVEDTADPSVEIVRRPQLDFSFPEGRDDRLFLVVTNRGVDRDIRVGARITGEHLCPGYPSGNYKVPWESGGHSKDHTLIETGNSKNLSVAVIRKDGSRTTMSLQGLSESRFDCDIEEGGNRPALKLEMEFFGKHLPESLPKTLWVFPESRTGPLRFSENAPSMQYREGPLEPDDTYVVVTPHCHIGDRELLLGDIYPNPRGGEPQGLKNKVKTIRELGQEWMALKRLEKFKVRAAECEGERSRLRAQLQLHKYNHEFVPLGSKVSIRYVETHEEELAEELAKYFEVEGWEATVAKAAARDVPRNKHKARVVISGNPSAARMLRQVIHGLGFKLSVALDEESRGLPERKFVATIFPPARESQQGQEVNS